MATKAELSDKQYRVKVEFWVSVTAKHAVDAEQQGWGSSLTINGSNGKKPEFVEVERLGEY